MAVRIESRTFKDLRLDALGELAGYNRYEALGRLSHLWEHCTDRQAKVVSEVIVRACLGPRGVEAILGADLGERTEGGIRVKGADGKIEWFAGYRDGAAAGGQARAENADRDAGGRFASKPGPADRPSDPAESSGSPPLDQRPDQLDGSWKAAGPAEPAPLQRSFSSSFSSSSSSAKADGLSVGDLVAMVQGEDWKAWKKFIGLGRWEGLAKGLAPYRLEEILQAKLEAEGADGVPTVGFLLRIIERHRAEPEAKRVQRREAQKAASPQRPKSTVAPLPKPEECTADGIAEAKRIVASLAGKKAMGG